MVGVDNAEAQCPPRPADVRGNDDSRHAEQRRLDEQRTRVTIGRRGRVLTHPLSCAFAVQPGVAIEYWRLSASRWQHAHAAVGGPQLQRKVRTCRFRTISPPRDPGSSAGRVGVFRVIPRYLLPPRVVELRCRRRRRERSGPPRRHVRSTGNPRARARSRECRRGPCDSRDGSITAAIPAPTAATTFSLIPPTGRTSPRRLISPVMARSLRAG